MNKFLFVFVSLCLFTPIQGLRSNNLKAYHRRKLSGDLHPKHRRLSQDGQLHLKIDGRGYFQYRLRVEASEASDDPSQQDAGATPKYNQAYSAKSAISIKSGTNDLANNEANLVFDELSASLANGARVAIQSGTGVCAVEGTYTVVSSTTGTNGELKVSPSFPPGGDISPNQCVLIVNPHQNAGANAGSPDAMGVEATEDGDNSYFSQVVYSHDGSLHVNKYGYLVDDNGLLLVSDGGLSGTETRTTDPNAKFHIHIPSRAEDILITPTGKVMVVELGGASFSKVGQVKLARFENAQGLNIRLKMRSNCNAANEDGFALGNWCAGTELDGKQHTYYAETKVSGVGIVGNPGSQGFGRLVKN